MAPYAIAHLKLGLFLEETGYEFDTGKRIGVFLTNSLDDSIRESPVIFEEFIAEESDQASSVKLDEPIMVVIGNPPYEGESANKNILWINHLVKGRDPNSETRIENYFEVDGKSLRSLGERNTKWLNNDYVKFMRFAHWRIEKTAHGIVAFITDRSFLGGPTFRGMRQSLLSSFDDLKILDLHGNVRGKRKGLLAEDENVFKKISQGTAISFFVKNPVLNSQSKDFFHADLWGRWEEFVDLDKEELTKTCKKSWLLENHIGTTQWQKKLPISPYYVFEVEDKASSDEPIDSDVEYEKGWKITDIFNVQSMGITGGRDKSKLCPQYSPEQMWDLVKDFVDLPIEEARSKFSLGKDARDWQISLAQIDINQSGLDSDKITPILFRPFDLRFTYYTGNSRGFHCMPRNEVMKNLINRKNMAICFIRSSREKIVSNFFVSDYITDKTILSSSDNANVTPLYIYPDPDTPEELQEITRSNLSQKFLDTISGELGYNPSPENIFYYIYAVLYSPAFRSRYANFLKLDFPRVPLTSNNKLFLQLSVYGEELVALHLMRSHKLNTFLTQFSEAEGDRHVDPGHPKYDEISSSVLINKKGDKFTRVPKAVWEFHIGGYQVCHKWLKDRKGRTLTPEDITHYQRIVVALQETIHLMQQIDEAIPGFPIE